MPMKRRTTSEGDCRRAREIGIALAENPHLSQKKGKDYQMLIAEMRNMKEDSHWSTLKRCMLDGYHSVKPTKRRSKQR